MKKNFARPFQPIVFLLVLCFLFQGCTSSKAPGPFTLTIAHLNDTHADLEPSALKITINGKTVYTEMGGFPAVTAKVRQLRKLKPNFLFLHAGDVFQGTLYFIKYLGMADLEFLKLMKTDAMCTGNHEFDKGPEILAQFIDEAAKHFPVLSANISTEKEPLLAGKIKPYTIKTLGAREVGIIGLTTIETPEVSGPGENLVFHDPLKTVKRVVTELTGKGIDIIVLLSHQGFGNDVELAKVVTGIDVVVSGHTHTLMGRFENLPGFSPETDYPFVVKNSARETVLVVQSWSKARVLGVLDVTFDSGGNVTGYSGHPLVITGNKAEDFKQKNAAGEKEIVDAETFTAISAFLSKSDILEPALEDAEAAALLDKYAGPILKLKQEVIGQSEADLWNVREPGDIHETAGKLPNGSLIAPVVADALLWKAKEVKDKNTQIVIQNAGGVRCDIPKGEVTVGRVYELLPFGNTMVLFDLTGAELKEVLKDAVTRGDGAYPYAAGLRYTADLTKTGGDFFTAVEVRSGESWVPLVDGETYRIAVNSFIASGKDGYTFFEEIKERHYDTGFVAAEIFMEYIKEVQTLSLPENRVKLIKK